MESSETKIIIAGFGGQGIVLVGNLIARAAVLEKKNVTGMVAYGAEMRGGTAYATVIVSRDEIASPYVDRPNMAIILNRPSLDKFEPRLLPEGLVLVNTSLITREVQREDLSVIRVDATNIAREIGSLKIANMVALGAFIEYTKLLEADSVRQAITDLFSAKKPEFVPLNLKAFQAGMEKGTFSEAGLGSARH